MFVRDLLTVVRGRHDGYRIADIFSLLKGTMAQVFLESMPKLWASAPDVACVRQAETKRLLSARLVPK